MPSASAGTTAGSGDDDTAGDGPINGGAAGVGGLAGDAGSSDLGGAPASGNGGAPASGGTAGAGGSIAGAGGTLAGAGGTMAGAGGSVAGAGGSVAGAAGGTQTTKGCAKISVPLNDASDKAHLLISLSSAADLSGATVSMRLYVEAGQGGVIFNYVQDSGSFHFLGVPSAQRQKLSGLSGWSTVTWNVGSEPEAGTGIVKTSIKNIGIEVNAQSSTVWSNPTIIYVDSITVSSPSLSFTFDTTNSVYTTPTTTSASGQALWLNNGSTDTTAAGTTISWQATCP